jgi:hypothetical protein
MKKILIHIVAIILVSSQLAAQYVLDNSGGKINNKGTIKVKNGQVNALPDTIGGRVEFLQQREGSPQVVPNIVYNQLVVANNAKKIVADTRDQSNRVRTLLF